MRTLVLNASREFLGVVSWKDAIADAIVGNCIVLEEYDEVVRSQYLTLHKPAVVMEKKYVHVKWNNIFRVSYSARNVFIRDNYLCQYCGYETSKKKLSQADAMELSKKGKLENLLRILPSLDHIIPESQGGPSTWENTVCACRKCNSTKDSKSLKESGMKLIREPKKPTGFKDIFEMKLGQIHDLWYDYLKPYWKE